MYKVLCKLVCCLFLSILIVGCNELGGSEVSAPVIFDETGLADDVPGIYTLTLEDKKNKKDKKKSEYALKISKKDEKYHIFMASGNETMQGDFIASKVPGSKSLYVFSISDEKTYWYDREKAALRGKITAHSIIVFRVVEEGLRFSLWNDEKKMRYQGRGVNVVYRRQYSDHGYMFHAEDVKRHLQENHAAIEAAAEEIPLLFRRPDGLAARLVNWFNYHRIVTLERMLLKFRGVGEAQYLDAEKKAREYLEYAEASLKERAAIDRKMDGLLTSYLNNEDAYIIPVTEAMKNVCENASIDRTNQQLCYQYTKALEARYKKIKQDGYIRSLIKVGAPQLKQGSSTRSYTYRTPDRTEISGRNIYTYPGETITAYTSDVDKFAYLHIPIINDSCSEIRVKASALFIYNPFNPGDNEGAVSRFIGNLYKAIVSSVDSSFGKRTASGELSLAPVSVDTLTIELDSSGFFNNGIRMREAKLEKLDYDIKNPKCIDEEAWSVDLTQNKVREALMNPWKADFPKFIANSAKERDKNAAGEPNSVVANSVTLKARPASVNGQHAEMPSTSHLQAMLAAAKKDDMASVALELEALSALTQPVRGDRKRAREANNEGLVALKTNDFAAAVARFREAAYADPADQEIANNLGYALLSAGRMAEARTALHAALALEPRRSSAWANLAMLLARNGEIDDGIAAYRLAFHFSRNQRTTRDFLARQAEDNDPKLRETAARALVWVDARLAGR